jgi:hypothetical protein
MTPWGIALQALIEKSGTSKGDAHRRGLAVKESFTKWNKSKRGPTIQILDRLLVGLGLTWHDWAEAYEAAKNKERRDSRGLIAAEDVHGYRAPPTKRRSGAR